MSRASPCRHTARVPYPCLSSVETGFGFRAGLPIGSRPNQDDQPKSSGEGLASEEGAHERPSGLLDALVVRADNGKQLNEVLAHRISLVTLSLTNRID